jgi:hypothetical protein
MKRAFYSLLTMIAVFTLAFSAAAQSQNQSLGDYARAVKKTKPVPTGKTTPKVYENDDLPASASLSVVGSPSSDAESADDKDKDSTKTTDAKADGKTADASKPEAKTGDNADKKQDTQIKPGQSAEDRDKALEAFKKKLDGQKDKIALLSRELEVLQREYQLKVSEFYADAAARVQTPNSLVDVDDKYKSQIAEKQKALDDANNQLSNMQEEGRRSGAPNSVTE